MTGRVRIAQATGVLLLVGRLVTSCASTDDTPMAGPAPVVDGGDTSALPADGAVGDAKQDTADASANTCSVDGFCQTTLPSVDSFDAAAYPPNLNGYTYGLRSVWVAPDHRVWAVSSSGHVLVFDRALQTWQVVTVLGKRLSTIWGASATELWIGGENGLLLRGTVTETGSETDAGTSLTLQSVAIDTTNAVLRIVGRSSSDVWIIPDGLDGYDGFLNRVFHFTGATSNGQPVLDALTVPGTWDDPGATVRVSALWLSGNDIWLGGHETSCDEYDDECDFRQGLVTWKGTQLADGGVSWTAVRLLADPEQGGSRAIAAGTTGTDGVALLAMRSPSNQAWVARVADDTTKLDAGPDAEPAHEGAYSWTSEVAHAFGYPTALWASNRDDVWMVGRSGTMRHFEGTAWQIVHLSPTSGSPVLHDLYDVQPGVGPSGEQELWVVGDDVAMFRTVKP